MTRPGTDRPSIILINCDDLGYGDLGCYGSSANDTPNLDRMAEEGTRFTDFYMASPVCSPSRGAMMTGCYPPRIGFGDFDGRWVLFPGQGLGLNPDEKTIASLLKTRGYATMLVGKWHCGDQPEFLPTRHGFDHYFGLPFSNDMGRQLTRENTYPPLPLLLDEQVIQEQPDQASLTERYVEHAVRFIRENRDRPFFLYLAHMHVHLPLYAAARFIRESRNDVYGACVAAIDWAAGVLFHELKRLDIDSNTLVIFTSDNGSRGDHGGSNAPLRGRKGTTWEGGQRVPCIMRWTGHVPAGRVCREPLASLEFLPTLATLAGVEIPRDRVIDGLDARPFILGEPGAGWPRQTFFFYQCNALEAIRHGRWKLHVRKGKSELRELYDLVADPAESDNLAERHPEIVAALDTMLDECRRDLGDSSRGIEGSGRRPVGRVANPRPLTEYDPAHPYIQAVYDIPDAG